MTFSVLARCEKTGQFGMAIATRPIAIGAKCPFVRPHIGGLMVQVLRAGRAGCLDGFTGFGTFSMGIGVPRFRMVPNKSFSVSSPVSSFGC